MAGCGTSWASPARGHAAAPFSWRWTRLSGGCRTFCSLEPSAEAQWVHCELPAMSLGMIARPVRAQGSPPQITFLEPGPNHRRHDQDMDERADHSSQDGCRDG